MKKVKTFILKIINRKFWNPENRESLKIVLIENKAYLYGGRNNKIAKDLTVLDLATYKWSKMKLEGNSPYYGRF